MKKQIKLALTLIKKVSFSYIEKKEDTRNLEKYCFHYNIYF